MKNHIIFKFIAILLCAAALLGAVAGGGGILLMMEANLYDKTSEQAYRDTLEGYAEGYADDMAVRYASRELGGAGDALVNSYCSADWYYDVFNANRIGYVIYDEDGIMLQDQSLGGEYPVQTSFSFPVSGNYMNVLSVMTQEEYRGAVELPEGVTTENEQGYVYDAIPEGGTEIYFVEMQFHDGSTENIGSPEEYLGSIYTTPEGAAEFYSAEGVNLLDGHIEQIHTYIAFRNWEGQLVYEISSSGGVINEGRYSNGQTYLLLRNLTEEVFVHDAVPPSGCAVTTIYVEYADGFAESAGGSPEIGIVAYDEEGNVCFAPHDSGILTYNNNIVTHIRFQDGDALVYEARDPEGVGYFFHKGGQYLFRGATDILPEETVPAVTEVPADGVSSENGEFISDLVPVVPDHGQKVYKAELWSESLQTVISVESDNGALGEVFVNGEGFVVFRCDGIFDSGFETCFVRLTGENGEILFEAYDRSAEIGQGAPVGKFTYDENGSLIFTTDLNYGLTLMAEGMFVETPEEQPDMPTMVFEIETIEETVYPTEEIIEEPSVPETLPEGVEYTEPVVTVPEALLLDEDAEVYGYYDYVAGESMFAQYTMEPMPEYTVEVQLAEGAFQYEHEWVLIRLLYSVQSQLPYLLGFSLLLFAIFAVYLCCAAGRRPGTTEVRPGGLNAMPLELYAALAVGGVAALAVAGMEGTRYLLRSDIQVGVLFAALCAYGAGLLIVAFCFACAAQFKTPGGWWWRKSLTGRCVKLCGVLCGNLLKFAKWTAGICERKLWPAFVRLCKAAAKVVAALLKLAGEWLGRLVAWLQKCGDRLWGKLMRFFSLLPLTWQWLLVGFGMFLLMAMVFATNGEELLVVLCIGICLGIIVYGAHCFGTLLESTRKMSKGDLDEKVDDKLMVGSFKDFAVELNGLADVAVVAAQKQLKSERMKTELITNVSHDIKTPLTSIINYVDLLQKPHTPEEQEKYLEVLDRQSQRLKKLIDDLMEMSKASTGNMSVDITRVDAAEAVNQALGEFADKLDKARLYPVFRQPEEPVYMLADGRLVWRVMSNLLSNAVKYALPGTRLYVDLAKVEGKVILSLKNISREELNVNADELLERFVRGDASRNTEGSGLGLNIAQSLMELQKGQLQILVDGDLFKVTLIFPAE